MYISLLINNLATGNIVSEAAELKKGEPDFRLLHSSGKIKNQS